METSTETAALCSKCKKNPRYNPGSTSPWCTECRTKYQKEYVKMLAEQSSGQAFARGVSAMRECVCAEFDRLAYGSFEGQEVCQLVRQMPGPRFD